MILAIDIGNSSIAVGCVDTENIYFLEQLSTSLSKTELEYAITLKNAMELHQISPEAVTGGIISSVVPQLSDTMRRAVKRLIPGEVRLVGPGLKTGLNIAIDNPAQLGSDMVVNAVAAIRQYPLPIIMIDMGTATTISAIDKQGRYVGNVIVPGVRGALDHLAYCTSQLPKISLETPRHLIGKNTTECMQSGAVAGTAALLDGMIQRIEEELGETATVIATGAPAQAVIPLCERPVLYDDGLMLKGLLCIYEKNIRQNKRRGKQ